MRTSRLLATGLLFLSASTAALAAATEDEAARIRTALQVYAGAEPGVVTVKVSGDDYIITLDPAPYLAKIPEPGFTAKVDPFVMTVRPKGNGQWDVTQSGPYNMMFGVADQMSFDLKIASNDSKGVFDESVLAFVSGETNIKNITIAQVMTEAGMGKTTSATSVESWTGTSTGTPRPDGAVDMSSSGAVGAMTIVSKMEPVPGAASGMPPMDYTATVAGADTKSDITGFRSRAILDIVAWFVARPSQELIVRDQAQLKEKIAAALPLWDKLDGSGGYKTVNVSTAFGQFGLASTGFGVTMSGVSKDAMLREALSLTGLTIPPGLAPPWSTDLVPHTFKIDFTLSGVDLRAPVDVMLAEADFSKDPPLSPESQLKLLPALSPSNTMKVSFTGGEISSATNSITYDGELLVNFAGLPTGKFNIRMKGMDATIAKVQAAAASDPTAAQAMGGLVAAKGFGKAEADGSLLWVVEIQDGAKVLINGVDTSAMMGGAQ